MPRGIPQDPVNVIHTTVTGHDVTMVRLVYVDLIRAYEQDPPLRHHRDPVDTGYGTVADYEALREYIKKNTIMHWVQYDKKTNECWIWIPAVGGNYPTRQRTWNTIRRRWPAFIDPECMSVQS